MLAKAAYSVDQLLDVRNPIERVHEERECRLVVVLKGCRSMSSLVSFDASDQLGAYSLRRAHLLPSA
jgi:hypothetical protein